MIRKWRKSSRTNADGVFGTYTGRGVLVSVAGDGPILSAELELDSTIEVRRMQATAGPAAPARLLEYIEFLGAGAITRR